MLKHFSAFFATSRGRFAVLLLIATGIASIVAGVVGAGAAWVVPVQTLLVLAFIAGTFLIYAAPQQRPRIVALAAPAIGAIILGLTVLSQYFLVTVGAALGWIIAGALIFRQQTPREVMQAVRFMRKGRYDEALEQIEIMIKRDKSNPEHYRLRAMILRLDGNLGRARRDYDTMLKFAPEGDAGDAIRAEAYDGLAEVHLQAGRYDEADAAAQQAHALFPDNWVPLYNLGLINDRLKQPQQTITHLTRALELRIPDQRQRLLAHLYLARAYKRHGNTDAAQEQVGRIETMWQGLEGLEKLLSDPQAAPLADVLAADVATARQLMTDQLTVNDL